MMLLSAMLEAILNCSKELQSSTPCPGHLKKSTPSSSAFDTEILWLPAGLTSQARPLNPGLHLQKGKPMFMEQLPSFRHPRRPLSLLRNFLKSAGEHFSSFTGSATISGFFDDMPQILASFDSQE